MQGLEGERVHATGDLRVRQVEGGVLHGLPAEVVALLRAAVVEGEAVGRPDRDELGGKQTIKTLGCVFMSYKI